MKNSISNPPNTSPYKKLQVEVKVLNLTWPIAMSSGSERALPSLCLMRMIICTACSGCKWRYESSSDATHCKFKRTLMRVELGVSLCSVDLQILRASLRRSDDSCSYWRRRFRPPSPAALATHGAPYRAVEHTSSAPAR